MSTLKKLVIAEKLQYNSIICYLDHLLRSECEKKLKNDTLIITQIMFTPPDQYNIILLFYVLNHRWYLYLNVKYRKVSLIHRNINCIGTECNIIIYAIKV